MEFHGYNVNNLSAYRLHFTIQDLLKNILNVFTLNDWMNKMKSDGQLDDNSLERLHQSIACWTSKEKPKSSFDIGQRPKLKAAFKKWQQQIVPKQACTFESFQQLLLVLLDLAEYSDLDKTEIELVRKFLYDQRYISVCLRLEKKDMTKMGLYFGEKCIHEIAMPLNPPVCDAVMVAYHADTGYIAIDRAGQIVNGSAFAIPDLKKKAVMVDINQFGYVILYEDGEINHNLTYTDAPNAAFRPVILSGYGFKVL